MSGPVTSRGATAAVGAGTAGAAAICPFAPSSFWKTPIPAGASLASNSAAVVSDMLAKQAGSGFSPVVNVRDWSATAYVIGPEQPYQALSLTPGFGTPGPVVTEAMTWVPLPDNPVVPTGDENIIIYQPAIDTLWEWGKFEPHSGGGYQAAYGGRIDDASKSNGVFALISAEAPGVSACGLALTGGMIGLYEFGRALLAPAGSISHALMFAMPSPSNRVSLPAVRTDGTDAGVNALSEGQRFFLDPALSESDFTAASLDLGEKIIARTLQKYGAILTDTAGTCSFFLQSAATGGASAAVGYNAPSVKAFYAEGLPPHIPHLWGLFAAHLKILPMNYLP